MRLLTATTLAVCLAAGLGRYGPAADAAPPPPSQCGKDTDCKGDRIRDAGVCQAPGASPDAAAATSGIDAQAPIPLCKAGDGKTRIAVWAPRIDAANHATEAPPQHDGEIVHIHVAVDASGAACNDTTLQTVSIPNENKAPGGLAVNIKGHAQFANGYCVLSGYYMNEDVPGMHQGWLETYFGAIDKQKIVLSDKFCLSRAVD